MDKWRDECKKCEVDNKEYACKPCKEAMLDKYEQKLDQLEADRNAWKESESACNKQYNILLDENKQLKELLKKARGRIQHDANCKKGEGKIWRSEYNEIVNNKSEMKFGSGYEPIEWHDCSCEVDNLIHRIDKELEE